MDIVFEEPSQAALLRHQGTGGKYLEWAIALREHEGEWAVLPDEVPRTEKSAAGTAQNIRRGSMKGFTPKGEYDALADGVRVFVKFLGERAVEPPKDGEPGDPPEGGGGARPIRRIGPAEHKAAPDEVRKWAQNNGFNVPARGRMPDTVWEAYERAQQKETTPGYR